MKKLLRVILFCFVAVVCNVQAHGAELRYMQHDFYAHPSPTFGINAVQRFNPQYITVLEHIGGGWVRICTYQGYAYVNLEIAQSVRRLSNFFRRYGGNVAIFYKNIESGFTYIHNPNAVFFGASVPKLYHALYVYTLAEMGLISLDTIHTYTRADYWGGSGVIRRMPFGREFTTRELLRYSIVYSDNVAFRMLVRNYNHPEFTFHDFAYSLRVTVRHVYNIFAQNTTARDAGKWAQAVFEYIESDGRYAHFLKYDLLNVAVRFIHSSYPTFQKYGWTSRFFHDLAIVYAESPYILIILSRLEEEEGYIYINDVLTNPRNVFREISVFVQEFNARYFPPREEPPEVIKVHEYTFEKIDLFIGVEFRL